MRKRGIFLKVFMYTTLFLILIICITVAIFAQQFISFYNRTQTQQLSGIYEPLVEELNKVLPEDYLEIARKFQDNNQSYNFYIENAEGKTIFATHFMAKNESDKVSADVRYNTKLYLNSGYILYTSSPVTAVSNYSDLIFRASATLTILLVLSTLGAVIFAKQMTSPIKKLANDTKKMANLEPIPPPSLRQDEIGSLANDVHNMYEKLKETIRALEEEKETQRYFFAAASHELKTPIAAVSAMLQGMLDDIGDYKEHPQYLWECLKLMKVQSKIINEILEIVQLNDSKINPKPEKLNLKNTVDTILPLYQSLIDTRELDVVLQIPETQGCITDYSLFSKALSNVLINAVQNTPHQGSMRIWSEQGESFVTLSIFNSGTQIDNSIRLRLFDPFYRADEARSVNNGNSGLGLTIVAKSLGLLKVEYALKNTPDGVLFWMKLPI